MKSRLIAGGGAPFQPALRPRAADAVSDAHGPTCSAERAVAADCAPDVVLLSTRAGMPPAIAPSGISPATTLPAAITAPAPILAPGNTVTRAASQAPSPISISRGSPEGPGRG